MRGLRIRRTTNGYKENFRKCQGVNQMQTAPLRPALIHLRGDDLPTTALYLRTCRRWASLLILCLEEGRPWLLAVHVTATRSRSRCWMAMSGTGRTATDKMTWISLFGS